MQHDILLSQFVTFCEVADTGYPTGERQPRGRVDIRHNILEILLISASIYLYL